MLIDAGLILWTEDMVEHWTVNTYYAIQRRLMLCLMLWLNPFYAIRCNINAIVDAVIEHILHHSMQMEAVVEHMVRHWFVICLFIFTLVIVFSIIVFTVFIVCQCFSSYVWMFVSPSCLPARLLYVSVCLSVCLSVCISLPSLPGITFDLASSSKTWILISSWIVLKVFLSHQPTPFIRFD